MRRILALVLASLLLVGCAQAAPEPLEWTGLSIMSPKGAPAVALVPLVENGTDTIDFVDGADLLSAELVKGEYDVIVAPVNLGAMLYSKGNEAYKLYAVLTWGNLFLVGNADAIENPEKVALFGDKAVPGIVYNTLYGSNEAYQGEFFNAVADVQAQLLTAQYDLGLLAEPLVTATLAKAKENNLNLTVIADVQAEWLAQTGFDNFPQAGLFIKADADEATLAQIEARYASLVEFNISADADPATIVEPIDTIGAAVLGVPSGALVSKAWDGLNISVQNSTDSKEAVEAFLELFKLNALDIYFQ